MKRINSSDQFTREVVGREVVGVDATQSPKRLKVDASETTVVVAQRIFPQYTRVFTQDELAGLLWVVTDAVPLAAYRLIARKWAQHPPLRKLWLDRSFALLVKPPPRSHPNIALLLQVGILHQLHFSDIIDDVAFSSYQEVFSQKLRSVKLCIGHWPKTYAPAGYGLELIKYKENQGQFVAWKLTDRTKSDYAPVSGCQLVGEAHITAMPFELLMQAFSRVLELKCMTMDSVEAALYTLAFYQYPVSQIAILVEVAKSYGWVPNRTIIDLSSTWGSMIATAVREFTPLYVERVAWFLPRFPKILAKYRFGILFPNGLKPHQLPFLQFVTTTPLIKESLRRKLFVDVTYNAHFSAVVGSSMELLDCTFDFLAGVDGTAFQSEAVLRKLFTFPEFKLAVDLHLRIFTAQGSLAEKNRRLAMYRLLFTNSGVSPCTLAEVLMTSLAHQNASHDLVRLLDFVYSEFPIQFKKMNWPELATQPDYIITIESWYTSINKTVTLGLIPDCCLVFNEAFFYHPTEAPNYLMQLLLNEGLLGRDQNCAKAREALQFYHTGRANEQRGTTNIYSNW